MGGVNRYYNDAHYRGETRKCLYCEKITLKPTFDTCGGDLCLAQLLYETWVGYPRTRLILAPTVDALQAFRATVNEHQHGERKRRRRPMPASW